MAKKVLFLVALALVFLSFISSVSVSDKDVSYDYYGAIRNCLVTVRQVFDVPQGFVDFIRGESVYISFKDKRDLKLPKIGYIYKPGKPFTDPESKKVFPGIDVPVGVVKIDTFSDGYYIGRVLKKWDEIKSGYYFKSPDRVSVEVLEPNIKGVDMKPEDFREVVKIAVLVEDIFESSDKAKFLVRMLPSVLRGPGGEILFSLSLLDGNNVTLVSATSLVRSLLAVKETAGSEREEVELSKVFTKDYKLIRLFDIDGDQRDEIIVAGDSFLDIFSVKDKDIVPVVSYHLGKRAELVNKIVYLDVAEVGGRKVIFFSVMQNEVINGLYKAIPQTIVFYYDRGKIKELAKLDYLVRVLKDPNSGKTIIIGWNSGEYDPFVDLPFLVNYENGRFVKGKLEISAKLKSIGSLYGWYYGSLDTTEDVVFAIIEDEFLNVYNDKGVFIASLPSPLGPYRALSFYITPRFFSPPGSKDFKAIEVAKKIYFERRIEVVKIDETSYLFTLSNDPGEFEKMGLKVSLDYYGSYGRVIGIKSIRRGNMLSYSIVFETPKYANVYALDFATGKPDGKTSYVVQLSYLKNVKKVRVDLLRLRERSS